MVKEAAVTFGHLVKEHRRTMDLTQAELARRVGCATITLRKIEADALRPSTQIAERLAMSLNIPLEERANFVRLARFQSLKSPTPPPTPSAPPSPEEIGKEDLSGRNIRGYELGEKIGSGGFGVVYRAVQPVVERDVAIKIILPKYVDQPDFIRRFEAEAQLVARLEHPHIIPLYDYWREPGVAYLVMRMLRGGSLESLIQNGPLPIDFTIRIMDQITKALHTAHKYGVIHRDLKPANIMLDEDENAYLGDFGIAKNLGNPNLESLTEVGTLIGTPSYVSPEQIRSEPIKPQADIYSLGILLYETLTGHLPFQGPTPIDTMMMHLSQPLPSLAEKNPDLPPTLDPVIQRATAMEPEDRYEDVLTLMADLKIAAGYGKSGGTSIITSGSVSEAIAFSEDIENPFKGLRAFGEADADHFYGRDTLVQELLGRMSGENDLVRFLPVVGPSGSGKSSVVKAGLIPALRRGGLPGSENWFIVDFIPGAHPFEELEAALLRVAVNPPESLLSQLKENERGLLRSVSRILPVDEEIELVLVIDQFEEIFTLMQNEDARKLFLDSLVTAVLDPRTRIRIVLTMRADFVDRPFEYMDFGEMMRDQSVFVLPMTPDELELAITGPVKDVGLVMEPGLVNRIVREVGDQPGSLPLLQYALTELFEYRDGRRLTMEVYEQTGGVLGALGKRAEDILEALDAPLKETARQMFLRLVTLGEGVEDTRRRVLWSELASLGNEQENNLTQVIEAVNNHRLLTFDHDPITRERTVEIAHEALLREWPQLREWLNDSRDDLRSQRALAAAADEWNQSNQDPSFLMLGVRLERYEDWGEESNLALTAGETAYIEASLEEKRRIDAEEKVQQEREQKLERRSRNVLRALVGVFAVATIVALGLSNFAFTQQGLAEDSAVLAQNNADLAATAAAEAQLEAEARATQQAIAEQEAKLATSRELSQAAIVVLDEDPELSVMLALQALETTHTYQAEEVLHEAVQSSRIRVNINAHDAGIYSMMYSPDGSKIVSRALDGWIKIWDSTNGEELLRIPIPDDNIEEFVMFSPDGLRLAGGGENGEIRIWDASTGEVLRSTQAHAENSKWQEYSPDGSMIATGGGNGNSLAIWDADSLELIFQVDSSDQQIGFFRFSPDGNYIAYNMSRFGVRFLDTDSWEEKLTIQDEKTGGSGSFHPTENIWVSKSRDAGTLIFYDLDQAFAGENTSSFLTATIGVNVVWDVIFNQDGQYLMTSTLADPPSIWQFSRGGLELVAHLSGHNGSSPVFRFSPDGQHVATAGTDGKVKIWDFTPSGTQEKLTIQVNTEFSWHVTSGYSPDGRLIATSGTDGNARVWDAETGEMIREIIGHEGTLWGVDFHPSANQIATAGSDYLIKTWDVNTGKEILSLDGHQEAPPLGGLFPGILQVAYSPDGSLLASAGNDGTLRLWDTITGENVGVLEYMPDQRGVGILAFSQDGRMIAAGGDVVWGDTLEVGGSVVKVWDVATLELLHKLTGNGGRDWSLAFSPDGTKLAVGTGTIAHITLWDLVEESEIYSNWDFSGFVGNLLFNQEGDVLIASDREEIKVLDASTGEEIYVLPGSGAGINWSEISPDGKSLLTTSQNGLLRVQYLELDSLIELASTRLTRWFTQEECKEYLHTDTCPPPPQNLQ